MVFFIIIGIFFLFVILNFISSSRYRPSKEEIKHLFRKALDGKMKPLEWDEFINVPIKHDKRLEFIRRKCIELNKKPDVFSTNPNQYFNELGLKEIQQILHELGDA